LRFPLHLFSPPLYGESLPSPCSYRCPPRRSSSSQVHCRSLEILPSMSFFPSYRYPSVFLCLCGRATLVSSISFCVEARLLLQTPSLPRLSGPRSFLYFSLTPRTSPRSKLPYKAPVPEGSHGFSSVSSRRKCPVHSFP